MLHHAIILGCDKGIIQLILDYNADWDRTKSHAEQAVEENRVILDKNKNKLFRKDSITRTQKSRYAENPAGESPPQQTAMLLSPEPSKGQKSPEATIATKRSFRELEKRGSTDEHLFVRRVPIN